MMMTATAMQDATFVRSKKKYVQQQKNYGVAIRNILYFLKVVTIKLITILFISFLHNFNDLDKEDILTLEKILAR